MAASGMRSVRARGTAGGCRQRRRCCRRGGRAGGCRQRLHRGGVGRAVRQLAVLEQFADHLVVRHGVVDQALVHRGDRCGVTGCVIGLDLLQLALRFQDAERRRSAGSRASRRCRGRHARARAAAGTGRGRRSACGS